MYYDFVYFIFLEYKKNNVLLVCVLQWFIQTTTQLKKNQLKYKNKLTKY